MVDDNSANKAGQPAAEVIDYSALPGRLDSVKGKLEDYQQYSDITLVATLQDYAQAGLPLELNDRPAFPHSPSSVARILLDENKSNLLTYVMKKYA